jgi:hypothetical protein
MHTLRALQTLQGSLQSRIFRLCLPGAGRRQHAIALAGGVLACGDRCCDLVGEIARFRCVQVGGTRFELGTGQVALG